MQTDWLLIRRLAAELDERLCGSRIAAAGLLPDGRFALDVRGGAAGRARLIVDAFAATPIVWLASSELAALDLRAAPGWSRAFADALEGRRIERVRGRTGDRLIAIDARARSRFGVDSDVRLVCELAPKFGNLVLLKDRTIVAAAREFEPSGPAAHGRTTVAGGAYEPPPLPAPRPDADGGRAAFAAYAAAATASREGVWGTAATSAPAAELVRALRRERPLLTPLVAQSLVAAAFRVAAASGEAFRGALLEAADDTLAAFERPSEIAVYRRATDGVLAQAHLADLAQFDGDAALRHSRVAQFCPVAAELAERIVAPVARDSFERRRAHLVQRVERRRASLASTLAAVRAEREDDGEGERLRLAGEALFTHHAEIAPGATSFAIPQSDLPPVALDPALDARANATAIFKRYRKLANRRVHAERRLGDLEAEATRVDELAWELERAEPEVLPELARTIDELVPSGAHRDPKAGVTARKRQGGGKPSSLRPHRFELGDGARLLVGRSPHGNAEVTFRLAKPDDWWFHTRGLPGAHVVLQIDDSREPTEAELTRAAETAAAFSSAAKAPRVEVDRTRRKYVRKRDTGPGQVWYVNAQTIAVTPARPDGAPLSSNA